MFFDSFNKSIASFEESGLLSVLERENLIEAVLDL
jgi:hypothetical protein